MIVEPLKLIIDGEVIAWAPGTETIHIEVPTDDLITATISDNLGCYSEKVYNVLRMAVKESGTYIILESRDDKIQ